MSEKLLPKVKALYEAVLELIGEDADIRNVKVSDITGRAGIGKGTAYEYFNNKEELICSALLHYIDRTSSQIMADIRGMKDCSEMFCYILESMEREIPKRGFLLQYLQLKADNGPIGKLLCEGIKEGNGKICTPRDLVDHVIREGIGQGVFKEKLPVLYMRLAVMSKMLVYSFCIMDENAAMQCDKGQMRRLLCEGLLKELG